jgi:hypothetical protein
MNVSIIAKYLTSARFEIFYHVPDSEKWEFFRHFLHAPFYDPSFCQIVDQIYATNQYELLKKLVRQMKQQDRATSFGEKDVDLILTLFWEETDPGLAFTILATLLAWNSEDSSDSKKLFELATNLLFSATCRQDKEAALCILEQ